MVWRLQYRGILNGAYYMTLVHVCMCEGRLMERQMRQKSVYFVNWIIFLISWIPARFMGLKYDPENAYSRSGERS